MSNSHRDRYHKAAHAMQSGVAMEHGRGGEDGSPKHLRVGVNAAMSDMAGLVSLLIAKGVFTEEEYLDAIATSMELEVLRYTQHLRELLGNPNITLA